MKKICFITPEFYPVIGGCGNATFDFAQELIKNGFSVSIITPNPGNYPAVESRDGIEIYRVKTTKVRLIKDLIFIIKSLFIVKKLMPDVIYAQMIMPSGIVSAIAGILWNKISITHARGVDVDVTLKNKLFYFFNRFALKYNKYVFTLSLDHKKKMQEFYNREVYVLTNGIKIEEIKENKERLKKELGFKSGVFNIIYVGRVENHKGLIYLIDAVRDIEGVYLRIIGEGDDAAKIKQYIERYNLRDKVSLLGKFKRLETFKYVKASDISVFPQLRAAGMGNAVLESMYLKTAVIGTDVGYFPELLGNNERGLIAKTSNSANLKDAIIMLKENNLLRKEIAISAFKYVKENHDWDKIAEEFKGMIE